MISAALLSALIAVESGGNDLATGRAGERGPLQISPVVLLDLRRFAGLTYPTSACFQRTTSVAIAYRYLNHYCTRQRLGREPTDRDYALTWHRGPRGPWKPDTDGYWMKVQATLKSF